jgi:hypothetical protein
VDLGWQRVVVVQPRGVEVRRDRYLHLETWHDGTRVRVLVERLVLQKRYYVRFRRVEVREPRVLGELALLKWNAALLVPTVMLVVIVEWTKEQVKLRHSWALFGHIRRRRTMWLGLIPREWLTRGYRAAGPALWTLSLAL